MPDQKLQITLTPEQALPYSALLGDEPFELICSRRDWLILTQSPLTGPVLTKIMDRMYDRGAVEVVETRQTTKILYSPNNEMRDASKNQNKE